MRHAGNKNRPRAQRLGITLCLGLLCGGASTVSATDPGGTATYTGPLEAGAFSQPSATLDRGRRLDFEIGRALFERLWVSAPSSTQAADGLGPLFNARACRSCHLNDGRGAPPGNGEDALSLVAHLSRVDGSGQSGPEPTYGYQLQPLALHGHRGEGRLRVGYTEQPLTLADGETVSLRHPSYRIEDLGYGELDPDARLSPRLAPQLIGLGLLEAIPDAAILQWADPEDQDGDDISGRAHWVGAGEDRQLGRFGWKAAQPTLDAQNQIAFLRDLGLSTPDHPAGAGDCTARQPHCLAAPDGNSPQLGNREAPREVTDLTASYTRHLAVPARRDLEAPEVRRGEALFHAIGCAACHRPHFRTADDDPDPALASQKIAPYTDLLLHDMGEGLADHRPEGQANGREWRTPPLWGIGLSEQVNGHGYYLHDGRARSLLEAILWHGGEAQGARDRVVALSAQERRALLRFVESL